MHEVPFYQGLVYYIQAQEYKWVLAHNPVKQEIKKFNIKNIISVVNKVGNLVYKV